MAPLHRRQVKTESHASEMAGLRSPYTIGQRLLQMTQAALSVCVDWRTRPLTLLGLAVAILFIGLSVGVLGGLRIADASRAKLGGEGAAMTEKVPLPLDLRGIIRTVDGNRLTLDVARASAVIALHVDVLPDAKVQAIVPKHELSDDASVSASVDTEMRTNSAGLYEVRGIAISDLQKGDIIEVKGRGEVAEAATIKATEINWLMSILPVDEGSGEEATVTTEFQRLRRP